MMFQKMFFTFYHDSNIWMFKSSEYTEIAD